MKFKWTLILTKIFRLILNYKELLIGVISLILVLLYLFLPRYYDHYELLRFYNKVGIRESDKVSFHFWLNREVPSFRETILATLDRDDADTSLYEELKPIPRETDEMSSGVGQLNLVVVPCGNKRAEALAMIRSALLMSQDTQLNVIAFVDYFYMQEFAIAILNLKWEANRAGLDFRFELKKTWFPEGPWKEMRPLCATQKLFLPTSLAGYDSVLYVDTDILFLSPIAEYWDYFSKMNSKQFATMAANDKTFGNENNWRDPNLNFPHLGSKGLDAGVMLMNLTRMRESRFEEKCLSIYKEYEDKLAVVDQEILNILFYRNPEFLLQISCAFNFRSSHCESQYDDKDEQNYKCKTAIENGVSVVHGNQQGFHKNVFKAFSQLKLTDSDDAVPNFIQKLRDEYENGHQCVDLTAEMLYEKFHLYLTQMENKKQEYKNNLDIILEETE